MSDLKIQGEVQISTEGSEAAFDRVADKAGQMASRLQSEGAKAGKAVDGIGAGAEKSAEQFTRAESRMTDSIKRATRQLEDFGKTASQKIELRISERGLDPAKFEPMLAKLRELEAAQTRVAVSSPRMGGGLQNLSYQMQDMIVQVNGGTDAMRAMSMQLPQMLIGFGAAGAAIGVVAALLPNLISAFGGAGENTKKFSDAMSDFDKAIGDVGRTVKTFDLDPLYKQFNESSAAVRAATIEQIKFQQAYLKTTQIIAEKKFGESLGGLGNYGLIDKLKGAAGNTQAENLADELGIQLSVAKELLPVLKGVVKGTEDVGLAFEKAGQQLLGGNQRAIDAAKSLADMAKSQRDAAAAQSAYSEALEKTAKGHVTTKDEAKKAADMAKKQAEELANLLNTINAKSSDFDSGYVKNVETLLMAFDRGKLSLGAFNDVFARYVAMQPGAVAAEKERAKALDAAWKAEAKLIEEMSKETDSLEKQVEKAREESEQIGLTKEQLNALKLARLDDAIATKEQHLAQAEKHSTSATEIELIRDQVEALKELRSVTASAQVKQANADALKEQADAWKKFTDDIERSLTDSLYRAFENGDSFGKAFAESLKNTFKTMVLKVAVQGVVSAGMSAVGLGSASSAGNLLSSGSSAYNLLSGGSNLYSTFATSSIGETLGLSSMGAGGMGPPALSALGSAMPYVAAALAIASMFSKESTPHAGGIAFGSASGISTPSTRDAIGAFYANPDQALSLGMMRSDWTSRNDAAMSAQLGPVAEGFAKTLDNILKANNLGTGYQVGLAFSADGEDPARGHATITDAKGNIIGSYKDKNDLGKDASAAMQKLVGTEIPQMLLSALEGMDLNDLADTYLDTLNIEGLSAEAAQQALGFVDASDEIVTAFEKLGFAASDINYDLVKAMGGFDAAEAALQAMVQTLDQIAASAAGTSDMFGNSIRNVKLSVLDDPGKYAFLDDEAARYRDVLSSLSDTNLISEYAGKLNSTIMEAWGVLNSDQQTAKADEFIGLLEAADKLALSRYDVAKENVTNQAKEIAAAVKEGVKEAVKEAMTEVTSSSVTASNAVTAAVERGINVRIDIDSGTAEVGYVGG